MEYENINLAEHREIIVQFRKDSFRVSFGNTRDFDEENYLTWLREKVKEFPGGFVLVKEAGNYIGQLELSIREYEGRNIGYIHLYYLLPELRGQGIGRKLYAYIKQYFMNHSIGEYHLRVSPTNISALKFYHKIGMMVVRQEVEGTVIRMKGFIDN